MKILNHNLIPFNLATVACVLSIASPALAATSASTTISASIVGGSCDIAAPATLAIMDGDPIPAEDITTTSTIAKTFNLTLSGCNGFGLTPSIKIAGDDSSLSGKSLFVSATSTSKGYGILLSTVGNTNFQANTNLAANKTITAATKTWGSTVASSLNGTIPLTATVSCGDCVSATLQGGMLNASLTFEFLYQ